MARDVTDAEPVSGRRDLVAWLESGCKAPADFKVGSEHEKILFHVADLSPVAYEGEAGVRALIEAMRARLGWEAIEDEGRPIGLYDAEGGGGDLQSGLSSLINMFQPGVAVPPGHAEALNQILPK